MSEVIPEGLLPRESPEAKLLCLASQSSGRLPPLSHGLPFGYMRGGYARSDTVPVFAFHCAKPHIAPSLTIPVDQAVDAHATRAPAPPTLCHGVGGGLWYHKRVLRAMIGRCLASLDEAEGRQDAEKEGRGGWGWGGGGGAGAWGEETESGV